MNWDEVDDYQYTDFQAVSFKWRRLAQGILVIHAVLLAWISWGNAPMFDEMAHLAAGIKHWESAEFDLYRVNPPLHRMVVVLPVLMASPKTDWSRERGELFSRPEFVVGKHFCEINGDRSILYFRLARLACIPFSILGGWVCYRWATQLFGPISGLAALVLWCFSPDILAWGSAITPDVAAASLGISAWFAFWRWQRDPTWLRSVVAGLLLGIAELVKTTWIILFVIWPLFWLFARIRRISAANNAPRRGESIKLGAILLIAVYMINLGYLFEGTGTPLKDFVFVSETLGGTEAHESGGNRFSGNLLGELWIPLPANYVRGIDFQKYEFEKGKWSYLCGEQKLGGWYHYYLIALLVKTPVGTLLLGGLAILLSACKRRYRLKLSDELILWIPAITILLLVSSQTGFNRYLRYVIPVLPFIFIAISRAADPNRSRTVAFVSWTAITASVVSSLIVVPYSLSYFNFAVGGPRQGHQYLADANIDWGQDLLRLKNWMQQHPEAIPINLAYFGYFEPETVGITASDVPPGPGRAEPDADPVTLGPQPGWYAVSINHLIDYHHYGPPAHDYSYFHEFEPVALIGYSIYVYHITDSDANRVRQKLGLPVDE